MLVGRAIHLSVDIMTLVSLSEDNDSPLSSEKIKNYNVLDSLSFLSKGKTNSKVGSGKLLCLNGRLGAYLSLISITSLALL